MWLFFWDAAKLIEDNVILSGLAFKIYYTGPKQWLYSTNYSPLLRQDPSGCPIQCLMNFVLFQPGWWELALFPALSGCWVLFPVILLGDPQTPPVSFLTCLKIWGEDLLQIFGTLSQALSFMLLWLWKGSCVQTLSCLFSAGPLLAPTCIMAWELSRWWVEAI